MVSQLNFNYPGSWPRNAQFFPNKLDKLIVAELFLQGHLALFSS